MPGKYQYDIELKSNVAKLLTDMKEVQDRLDTVEGKEYKIKLNVDEKKLSNVISNLEKMLDSLGKGSGDFKQFENLSKELSSIVSEVQNLSKAFGKVDDSGTKTLLSSIQNIDKSLSELSQHIINVNKNMSNIGGDTNGTVKQVENISNAYDNASKSAEKLAEAQSKIGNKSNISSENDSLQSTIEALKQLSKLPGGDTLSLGKIMNHIAEGAKLANPEVKKLLESLKLIDSEGKIIGTHINEGTLNSGVDLNDKFAIISRNDAIENVDKLIEKEKEAQQQGILLARTLASIDIGKLHYDIQELAQGTSVHQMKNSTLQQFVDETRVLCNATDEQILKLYSDAQKLSDLGFKLDLNPSNIRYDENSGFSFIDLELRKINEEAPQTVAIMHTLTQSLMGFMGQRNRLNWDDEENFYTKDNYLYLQNMLKTYERLQQIFSSKLSTPDFNQAFSDSLQLVKTRIADIEAHFENLGTPIKDVFQGGSSSAEKLEQNIKNIESATDRATESVKEYRKILSQVGEFDIDSKVSAMYKRNDGQLESWTWRAKKDDEGNILYDQNGKIDYDEPTITVISKYEQLEKIIVKADNELRNLQKDLSEIKAYDPTASTTNIEAKISDQKEYIQLLEQTVKVISQSDEYLLDEQQIIDARNKAAREYALTMGSKQEKTDAKQSASDEKKRLANIEQVNRALNKQQITIDAIEKTYNKSTNPDLDREVSNQQDLAELAQKKLDIQTKINSLQGQERNSANEQEYLELEKLIAEYKELAKYKLKANNPSKQELGGQNLQTLIQVQISNYDKLITKAEKYGDSTSDTVEKLKEQRDILSKIGADGKYTATADQYYASRDTYKVESAALSAFEAETKAIEQKTQAVKRLKDELEGYNNQIPKKPIDGQRSDYFEGFIQNYKNAIAEAKKYLDTLGDSPVTEEVKKEWERLIDVIKKAKEEMDAVPNAARGSDALSRGKEIDTITKYLNKFTGISKQAKQELNGLLKQLQSGDPSVNVKKIHERFLELTVAEREAGREARNLFDIFKDKKIYSFLGQAASMFSFYDLINLGRQSFETIRGIDTALVDLKKTTAMNSNQLEEFYYDSNDVAKQMGVTTQAIIEQASAWSRLGYNTKESSTQMAELSSQFAAISPDMDLDTATDGLVSSMKAFDIEVSNVERDIMDNINRIGNTAATSNGEIVDMLTRSSAAMAAANNTIQETIALETAAVEITRNAETTGTAFKTLSMRIRGRQTLPPYTVMYMLCA